jgi:SAM-dependent methyltransferase
LRAAATPMAEADPGLPEARFEAATCDACGSAAQTKLYQFDFDGEASGIVCCGGCGLAYSSPRPTPNALGAFYGDGYYSFGPPKLPDLGAALSFKERLRRTILARHMGYSKISGADAGVPALFTRFLARFLVMPDWQDKGVLLDVGCGSGERMLELRSFGWAVRGLEFSESAANAGRSVGLDISVGDLTNAKLKPGSFTTIAFYHSLEHVYSPDATLKAACLALAPGGVLLVAVPNFGSSERRLFGKRWDWLQMPTHLYHFDRATLTRMVAGAGFSDIEVRYSFHGYSVDTARAGVLRSVAEIMLKIYALAAAITGDGKALTLVARKAT